MNRNLVADLVLVLCIHYSAPFNDLYIGLMPIEKAIGRTLFASLVSYERVSLVYPKAANNLLGKQLGLFKNHFHFPLMLLVLYGQIADFNLKIY